MANNSSAVLAGKPASSLLGGGVLVGPLGTPVPTDASTAADAELVPTGYISDDGVTESVENNTEKIRAWGGDVVKIVSTEHSVTYEFTFIETVNTTVLETVYGEDNVDVTPATATTGTLHAVKVNSNSLPHKVFVINVMDGDARIRIVIPVGQVTEVGEITYTDGEVIGYPVTVEAFNDADGNKVYKYTDDGVHAA